jgi:hypothetical protein
MSLSQPVTYVTYVIGGGRYVSMRRMNLGFPKESPSL